MRQKKSLLFVLILTLFFSFGLTSHGWQGRMAGMEDPYGLVADESDYLTHVAQIAKGKGLNFYGGYRFTYTEVEKFQTEYAIDDSVVYRYDLPGDILGHNALLGSSFALGPGRMGVFFAYDGIRGDLDTGFIEDEEGGFKNKDELDNFALRLMYGIPVGNFNFGAEAGVAYRKEKNSLLLYSTSGGSLNVHLSDAWPVNISIPPFISYDAAYWEVPLKVGFSGKTGPLETQFTLRGGIIVAGDNTFTLGYDEDPAYDDLDGNTKGWSAGADFWLRYHLGNGLSLPFVVRADYWNKTRDGRGLLLNMFGPEVFRDYKNEETAFTVTLGGGVDKAIGQNTRLAAGIYYSYLQSNKEVVTSEFYEGIFNQDIFFDDFPSTAEHRATLRLAGEHALSPVVALRAGMGFFYGFVTQDIVFGFRDDSDELKLKFSSDGYRWGAGASLGASIKLKPVTLEPFLNAGYQYLNLSDDFYENGVIVPGVSRNDKRERWYVGGGLAVSFGQ